MISKEVKLTILSIVLIILSTITYAIFIDNSKFDFDQGTYFQTFYNISGFIRLNNSFLNGTYISRVFNANKTVSWINISLIEYLPEKCSGNPINCSNFSSQPICENQQGCSWDQAGPCSGGCNCFLINLTNCNNVPGCTKIGIFCIGTCACSNLTGTQCNYPPNCIWDQAGPCSGNPINCSNFSSQPICENQQGCSWIKTNIIYQVKSCSLADCSDKNFIGPDQTTLSYYINISILNITPQQYFQYKTYFITEIFNYTPKLYNVTINYIDDIPPSTITNLNNISQSTNYIYWNWTNPSDSDFLESIVYLESINIINTSNNYYNATNLIENTTYTIKIYTKDNLSNINYTEVISITKTHMLDITIPPNETTSPADEVSIPNSGGRGGGGGVSKSNTINNQPVIESKPKPQPTTLPIIQEQQSTQEKEKTEIPVKKTNIFEIVKQFTGLTVLSQELKGIIKENFNILFVTLIFVTVYTILKIKKVFKKRKNVKHKRTSARF